MDIEDERIIADSRRRLRLRAGITLAATVVSAAVSAVLGAYWHVLDKPVRWWMLVSCLGIYLVLCAVGATLVWWFTRLPPEALTDRIMLSQSDRIQNRLSRLYLLFPLILGLNSLSAVNVARSVLQHHFRSPEFMTAIGVLGLGTVYLMVLTGWGTAKRGRIVYDEELFRSFRTRGYVVGFWVLMGGVSALLALGLFHPDWAIEIMPVLLFLGISVPAFTIGLLNRRAERGG